MLRLRLDIAALVYGRLGDAAMLAAVHALSQRLDEGLPPEIARADALAALVSIVTYALLLTP